MFMKSKNKLRMLVNYLFTTLIYLNTLKGTGIKGAVWSNQTQDQIVKQSPCTNTTKEVDIQIKRECLDAQVESLRQFFADPQVFHDQAVAKKANCAESDAYFQLAVILNQNLNYNKRQVTDFGRSDCYKCLNTSLCVFSESSELKTGDFYSLTELFMVLTDHNDFLLGYFKSFFENDEQIQEHARYSYFDALRSNPLPKAVCFYNPNKSANIQEEHMLVINLAETQTDSEFLYLRLPKTTIKKNFVPLTIKRKSLSFFKRKIINFLYLIYFARSKRNFDYLRMLALIDLIFLYLENDLLNLINFVIVYCYRLQRYTNLDISSRNNQDVHNLFLNYDSFTNVDLFESTLVSVLWWKNQNYRFTTLHESFVCLYHKILIQFFVYNADAQVALKELAVYQKFTFRCYVSFYGTDFFN